MLKRGWLCLICLLAWPSHAAEQTLTASFAALLDAVEETLREQEIEILEQAETDRFAIFYLSRQGGGGATVSLYTLPQQDNRVTLTVNSDSPADPLFDRDLLRQLVDAHSE